MTLVDANVLLYAYDSESPHQAPARQWLAAELSSGRPVRLALITLLAFVRISTDRRVSRARCLPAMRARSSNRGSTSPTCNSSSPAAARGSSWAGSASRVRPGARW